MANEQSIFKSFVALPSDPSQLTAEHMRLVFADPEVNRQMATRLTHPHINPSTVGNPVQNGASNGR